MRNLSSQLLAALSASPVSSAYCIKITSALKARSWYFTSHDQDLVIASGTYAGTYKSSVAYNSSNVEISSNMDSTNLSIEGAFDITNGFTRIELISGLLDHARVIVFIVDFTDTSLGYMEVLSGFFGDISPQGNEFTIDFIGDDALFNKTLNRLYESGCDAEFCDARCKLSSANYTSSGAVSGTPTKKSFVCSISDTGSLNHSDITDWFTNGVITWTGACENSGLLSVVRVYTYSTGTKSIVLLTPTYYTIAAGDTFTILAGCQKRFVEDCSTKFENHKRFKGFPFIPTADQVRASRTPKNSF